VVFPCGATNPAPTPQLFAGITAPNTSPECRGLWDVISTNVNGYPLLQGQFRIRSVGDGVSDLDYVSLVLAIAEHPTNSRTQPAGPPVPVPTNLPPIAHADSADLNLGVGVKVIDVLNNDRSADGKPLEIAAVGSPAHGKADVIYQRSAVLYTANPFYT